jgi:hypothetical protein
MSLAVENRLNPTTRSITQRSEAHGALTLWLVR